jgi:hypothetical protein
MRSPEKSTKTILAFLLFAVIFLDYWTYSQQYYRDPGAYTDVLAGSAVAPIQYRVGAVRVASFLARHGHMGLRHGMTILDGLSAGVAVYVLYSLLRRSMVYRAASRQMQWFGSAVFLVLVQYYLVWLTWYQRPETLPTAGLVALNLWLLTLWRGDRETDATRQMGAMQFAIAACLVLLAAVQGLVRADVAVAISLGILVVCLTPLGRGLSVPRVYLSITAVLAFAVGAGVQFYMMRVAYPHATYGSTPVFQLVLNVTDRLRIVPFVIFLLPWGWTLWKIARRRFEIEAPMASLLAGSVVFLGFWSVLGKIDEVRIFLPFALALAPLTAQTVMQRVGEVD